MITPERSISVIPTPQAPEWKTVWDTARLNVKEGDLLKAADAYAQLIAIKPNIEEATWEYCKVLIGIEDFKSASKLIAILLEADPLRLEYQLSAGRVAFHNGDFPNAIKFYGRVLEKDPTGSLSSAAIEGLADSLKGRGRKEESFSLSEQLLARDQSKNGLLEQLAIEAGGLGRSEKARRLFKVALENETVDDEVVFSAIEFFDGPEDRDLQLKLLLRYLEKNPDYNPFRIKIISLYEQKNNNLKALEHLTLLIKNSENKQDLLLKAATLAKKSQRPGQALEFLGEYEKKFPGNKEVTGEIEILQRLLASDLLAIVENDGAAILWQDLEGLAQFRLAVFEKMASILEQKGKDNELLSVLKVIYSNSRLKDNIGLRLAQQLHKMHLHKPALNYLEKIEQTNRSKDYFLFRAKLEILLGYESEALHNLMNALNYAPRNQDLRGECIKIAGSLGYINIQRDLFNYWLQQERETVYLQHVLTHIRLLGYNYLAKEVKKVSAWAMQYFLNDHEKTVFIGLEEARALRRVENKRYSQQKIREFLNRKVFVDLLLFELVENAIDDENQEAIEQWLQVLVDNDIEGTRAYTSKEYQARLAYVKAKIFKLNNDYVLASRQLEEGFEKLQNNSLTPEFKKDLLMRIRKEQLEIEQLTVNKKTAIGIAESVIKSAEFNPGNYLLAKDIINRASKNSLKQTPGKSDHPLYVNGNPVVSRLLAVADEALKYGNVDDAKYYLNNLPKNVIEHSVLASLLLSIADTKQGDFKQAVTTLSRLNGRLIDEPYFCNKAIALESKQGHQLAAMELLEICYGLPEDIHSLATHLAQYRDEDAVLSLARLLWADKQYEKSLAVYETILSPSIMAILTQQFSEKKIKVMYPPREESIWRSMFSLLQSEPYIVEEIMEPVFLIDNLGNDTGKIVAENYARYSWQHLIKSEYEARDAIYRRNYTFAEQRYKKLHAEEKTQETLADLATIYERTGEYRKEAKIYEDIRSSGAPSPELKDSIERSTLRVKPQNDIDTAFIRKEGRDGYIDIENTRFGTSFWFIHDYNKEFKFAYWYNQYESVDGSQEAESNSFSFITHFELSPSYELTAGVGAEKLNGESGADFLYELRLDAQLDDHLKGFLVIDERLVYDSIESITQHLKARSISTGLSVDTSLGLAFGGDLLYRTYDDDNSQNRFHGFTTYTIFGETVRLDFRYDFNFLNSDLTNPTNDNGLIADSENETVTSYWSPDEFNEHQIGIHFQHDFLGYDDGENRKMSYYSVDASIGAEDDDTLVYSGKFDIFLEMSPHFLLKGNFSFSTSDNYEETDMSASLHYRW